MTDLTDIHAGVTAQWTHSSEVIGSKQSRDDAILIHLPDHGGIHKVHKPILIHGNTWKKQTKQERVKSHKVAGNHILSDFGDSPYNKSS